MAFHLPGQRLLCLHDATHLSITIKKVCFIQQPTIYSAKLTSCVHWRVTLPFHAFLCYGHLQHFVYLAMELLAKTQALELAATSFAIGVCVEHPLAPDPSKHQHNIFYNLSQALDSDPEIYRWLSLYSDIPTV
jgi:hypothetical protein